jgi:hypothetical protein
MQNIKSRDTKRQKQETISKDQIKTTQTQAPIQHFTTHQHK